MRDPSAMCMLQTARALDVCVSSRVATHYNVDYAAMVNSSRFSCSTILEVPRGQADGVLPLSARRVAIKNVIMLADVMSGLRVRDASRRRRAMTADLLNEGVSTLILESPFYGGRKPPGQERSKLLHVADLIKLGAMTILESLWLIHMLRREGVRKVRARARTLCGTVFCRRCLLSCLRVST